jgi:phenylalanyl-tRNA synthetase beta chain
MKFTYNWLKQYVDLTMPSGELSDRLTMAGLEVEAEDDIFHDLDKVKVAEILSVSKHPNADRLTLCQVQVGDDEFKVVCGAPNARAGLFTAIALPGAVLKGDMKIKKGKIRGESSEGMLCSERDLGISEEHEGIMELDWLTESGKDLTEALGLKDTLIEIDLTPNRPDCTSVIGVAREVAAFVGTTLKTPLDGMTLPEMNTTPVEFDVDVQDADCSRYAARLLKNVTIAPSPWWLKRYLLAVGLRPINNVVDITNFVMMEYGQPLHAFDYSFLAGGKIIVRKARDGERMNTLDGTEQTLDSGMLMICDAEKPVAVAGVMGGENSEVSNTTTEVLLESACFNPISIRRTARKLNMGTDSSYRFERGVDPELAPRALERAVRLIVELAGAEEIPGGIDYTGGVKQPETLSLRVSRTNDLLGYTFTSEDLQVMLSSIELTVKKIDDDTLAVTPPSFRIDLEREVDLIEEVARLKGYNEFPQTMPVVSMSTVQDDAMRLLRKDISSIMTASGFNEAINYSFVSPKHSDMLGLAEDDPLRRTVSLLNPLGEDQSVMRTTLLPGLLENVRHNINRQCPDIRLFEIGKGFHPVQESDQPVEKQYVTAVVSGRRNPGTAVLHFGVEKGDILDMKGVVSQLIAELGLENIDFDLAPQDVKPYAEKGSIFRLVSPSGIVGECGKIHSRTLKEFGIKQDVYYLDCELDLLLKQKLARKNFTSLPKYPSVKWDIAMLVPDTVGAGDIVDAVNNAGEPLIEQAELFDVYRGKPIKEGLKSVAVTVTYRSPDQTLDDETVGQVHKKITDMIVTGFHGQLREE